MIVSKRLGLWRERRDEDEIITGTLLNMRLRHVDVEGSDEEPEHRVRPVTPLQQLKTELGGKWDGMSAEEKRAALIKGAAMIEADRSETRKLPPVAKRKRTTLPNKKKLQLREELSSLRPRQLTNKAEALGIDSAEIDVADDAKDRKTALIDLIVTSAEAQDGDGEQETEEEKMEEAYLNAEDVESGEEIEEEHDEEGDVYYELEDESSTACSEEEFEALVVDGTIRRTAPRVWTEGMSDWQTLGELAESPQHSFPHEGVFILQTAQKGGDV